jgi:hypothetical protein
VVKKASDEAFMKTVNGTARSGKAEAGFSIEYKDGKISIANKVDSVNSDKKANELSITTDAGCPTLSGLVFERVGLLFSGSFMSIESMGRSPDPNS